MMALFLIKQLYIILQALLSGILVDSRKLCSRNCKNIYMSEYSWYYMPSLVHKILTHIESIINHFAVLLNGQLSEDTQESRNKNYKKIRFHQAQKCS